jgi:hypothetical protein
VGREIIAGDHPMLPIMFGDIEKTLAPVVQRCENTGLATGCSATLGGAHRFRERPRCTAVSTQPGMETGEG